MKSVIILIALHAFFAATLYATPVDLFSSSKKGLGGWYHARASFVNNDHTKKRLLTPATNITATNNDGVNIRSSSVNAQITFYEGEDLTNSACYDRNGLPPYNAKDTDFIAAMRMTDFEFCYQCLRIKRGRRHVIVKVIDKCGGCPPDADNVDLTKSAFEKLATLDEGRVDIRWKPIPCPEQGRWPTFEVEN